MTIWPWHDMIHCTEHTELDWLFRDAIAFRLWVFGKRFRFLASQKPFFRIISDHLHVKWKWKDTHIRCHGGALATLWFRKRARETVNATYSLMALVIEMERWWWQIDILLNTTTSYITGCDQWLFVFRCNTALDISLWHWLTWPAVSCLCWVSDTSVRDSIKSTFNNDQVHFETISSPFIHWLTAWVTHLTADILENRSFLVWEGEQFFCCVP